MRIASLLVLVLMASLVWAQEQAPSAPAPPPAEPAAPAPAAQPAPQLGHPLDPADVDTLTGRSPATDAPGYRYYYPPYAGGYPAAVPLFSGSQFSTSTRGSSTFTPFAFGRFHGRNFFFSGHTGFGPVFAPFWGRH